MLQPQPPGPVPADTARVARAAFPKGSPLLALRDELGTVFADDDFAALYPDLGQPAYPPWRLALVTVLQFREDLSDRKAADAVRGRIDWKYLLGLPLDDPASTRASSASSGRGSSRAGPSTSSWTRSSTLAASGASSASGAASGPTPPTSSPTSGR